MVDVEHELLKPPSTAPLTQEPIYASLPVFVGGPHHGAPVPVSLMNRSHIQMPVRPPVSRYFAEGDEQIGLGGTTIETATYERGKFEAGGSRRVLDVWYFVDLTGDERGALTWLLILERAGLADG